jgi:hypothetical protein
VAARVNGNLPQNPINTSPQNPLSKINRTSESGEREKKSHVQKKLGIFTAKVKENHRSINATAAAGALLSLVSVVD